MKRPTKDISQYKLLFLITIFLCSLGIRLVTITVNGRVWDEEESAQINYQFGKMIRSGDFSNNYWWHYVPDHPRLVRYLYSTVNWLDVDHVDSHGHPVFKYDLTASRTLAAFVASLTVLLVFLYGWKYFSPIVGITASCILSLLPVFLGHSQISMFEPFIIFFFTASVFSFTELLINRSKKKLLLTGIITGLALAIKETNLLLLPLFITQYYTQYLFKSKKINLFPKDILFIFLIAVAIFFLHWPMIWFHLDYFIKFTYQLRVETTGGIPELLWGHLHRTTMFHYVIYFLTTTPILVLFFFIVGVTKSLRSNKWLYVSLLLWFIIPFLQSFYPKREHGIRYIIEFYAPLSILAGIGFDYLATKITNSKRKKLLLFIPVILYFCIVLQRISPYYLNYFNISVGGTKNVYEKKLLHMGWWGDGIKEAAEYVKAHARKGDEIGIALSPSHTLPPLPGLNETQYSPVKKYDYILVNNYHIIRDGFDDTEIKENYTLVKTVTADGAILVSVYKKK